MVVLPNVFALLRAYQSYTLLLIYCSCSCHFRKLAVVRVNSHDTCVIDHVLLRCCVELLRACSVYSCRLNALVEVVVHCVFLST